MSQVIRYEDGTLIEIAADPTKATPVGSSGATQVAEKFDDVIARITPLISSIAGLAQASAQKVQGGEVSVELGLAFSAEGNFAVCKTSAEGSIAVKISAKGP